MNYIKELYCFSCGAKDITFKEPGWVLQFNGMLCPICVVECPGKVGDERIPITLEKKP